MVMTCPLTREAGADVRRRTDCAGAVSSMLHGVGASKEDLMGNKDAAYLCMFENMWITE